jgi:hypothetical protein
MAKSSSARARGRAAQGSPGKGGSSRGRAKGRKSSSRRRGQPERNPWAAVLMVLAAVAVLAGGIFVGLSLGDPGGDDEGGVTGGQTGDDFHSLVIDGNDPRGVFVGGPEAVSASTNGGLSWREINSLRDADALGWAVTSNAVYVSGDRGLNRSTDGSSNFELVNDGLPSTDVQAFGGTDSTLYGVAPDAGVFAGQVGNWEVRSAEAGRAFVGRIVVDPDDDQHLYAADSSAGVAESTDGGRTWRVLDSGLSEATWLSRGGAGLEVLVASGPSGAALSRDRGETWQELELPDDATLVEAFPGDANLLYTGIHDGERVTVQISNDAGETWTSPDAPNAQNPQAPQNPQNPQAPQP